MPREHQPSRKLNVDDYPYNRLPVVTSDKDGAIRVLRGELDTATLTLDNRTHLLRNAGKRHVVFTNRLGQHILRCQGDLMVIGQDLTKIGRTGFRAERFHSESSTLADIAEHVRRRGQALLDAAARLDAAADDGWVLVQGDVYNVWWDMEDTKDGPSFATPPRP